MHSTHGFPRCRAVTPNPAATVVEEVDEEVADLEEAASGAFECTQHWHHPNLVPNVVLPLAVQFECSAPPQGTAASTIIPRAPTLFQVVPVDDGIPLQR